MKTKIGVIILAAAGVYVYAVSQHRTVPSDLRDAVADNDSFASDLAGIKGSAADVQIPPAAAPINVSPLVSAGDRVISAGNVAGTVKEVFSNGIAYVRLDTGLGDTPQKIKELGRGVECYKNICKKSRVIRFDNVPGTVKEIFTNGVAYVRFDNALSCTPHKISELGVGVDCFKGICKKDRIIDARNVTGTVMEVFTNGIARVMFDDGLDPKYIDITTLNANFHK
jgi:translation initiation factor IF-1